MRDESEGFDFAYFSQQSQKGMVERMLEIKRFFSEESGIGVVEIILILVVIIGLILIFKNQLTSLVNKTFGNINKKAGTL